MPINTQVKVGQIRSYEGRAYIVVGEEAGTYEVIFLTDLSVGRFFPRFLASDEVVVDA